MMSKKMKKKVKKKRFSNVCFKKINNHGKKRKSYKDGVNYYIQELFK